MKIMYLFLLFLLVLAFTNCGHSSVISDKEGMTEKRGIKEFTDLELSGAFEVKVTCGISASLEIIADKDLMEYVVIENEDNTLRVYSKKELNTNRRIVINITTNKLSNIFVSGANKLVVEELENEKLFINLSGASTTKFSGKIKNLEAEISGANSFDTKDLIAEDVSIDVSGASNGNVYAGNSLDVSVSGVSKINYYGNPKNVNKSVSGFGSINKK